MKLIKSVPCIEALLWKRNEVPSPFPPTVAEIDGGLYRLSGFGKASEHFFHIGTLSLNDAIEASISILGEPEPFELGRLIKAAEALKADYSKLTALASRIRGRKNAESLKLLCDAPESLLAYMAEKQPSMKTIGMYVLLPDEHKAFLHELVLREEPSVSSFRNAVETLTDYRDSAVDSGELRLTERLEASRREHRAGFMAEFAELTRGMGAGISSADSFETAELTVSFSADNPQEFIKKCEELYKSRENAEKIYKFLEENDIY